MKTSHVLVPPIRTQLSVFVRPARFLLGANFLPVCTERGIRCHEDLIRNLELRSFNFDSVRNHYFATTCTAKRYNEMNNSA